MSRWPEPVRQPLPVGILTEKDIDEIFPLTTRYLDDPQDPDFNQAMQGFVGAVRAALIECEDALSLARIGWKLADQEDGGQEPDYRKWQRIGEEIVARKVARRVIDALREWVPEQRS
jgi:hypothetical protein